MGLVVGNRALRSFRLSFRGSIVASTVSLFRTSTLVCSSPTAGDSAPQELSSSERWARMRTSWLVTGDASCDVSKETYVELSARLITQRGLYRRRTVPVNRKKILSRLADNGPVEFDKPLPLPSLLALYADLWSEEAVKR
jgi:hypothetical protein